MIDKWWCLYIAIFLYGGAITALFVRALMRRRVLEEFNGFKDTPEEAPAGKPPGILTSIRRRRKALRALGRSLADVPVGLRRRYRLFRALTYITTILFLLLIIHAIVANRLCGP